ncbi:MAG: Fic family protein [Candidatus Gracilibacteria bacterium]|nr:Fic family protein [Candidatus Gracilibacteria bacterium]
MNITKEIIKNLLIESLIAKFEYKISKANINIEKAKEGFFAHIEILSKFLHEYYNTKNILEIGLFKDFHKLFYPSNFKILVSRTGVLYENLPGEWRKHEYNPQIKTKKFTKYPENIENDFIKIIDDYNSLTNKKETDVLKLFFDFLNIHPFGDSNLNIISIIIDLELLKYGFISLNILKIRFKDRQFMYFFEDYYRKNIEKESVLDEVLSMIRDFNNGTLSNEIMEAKNKQEIYSTNKLL